MVSSARGAALSKAAILAIVTPRNRALAVSKAAAYKGATIRYVSKGGNTVGSTRASLSGIVGPASKATGYANLKRFSANNAAYYIAANTTNLNPKN